MTTQLEFGFVHLEKHGGQGVGLPGPMQSWCYQYNMVVEFSHPFLTGNIQNNTVRVGVVTDTEIKKRVMFRDLVEDTKLPFGQDRIVNAQVIPHRRASCYYSGFTWCFDFFLNEHHYLAGQQFDIILTDLSKYKQLDLWVCLRSL
jgi:hypothetical protein